MGGFLDSVRRLFSNRLFYYALAWALALMVAEISLYAAWHSFDNVYVGGHRNDGTGGHATIDFGGQYLMGRLLIEGHGGELYNRSSQRLVLTEIYPPADQDPKAERTDAENLMYWMMGSDDPQAPQLVASCLAPLAAHDGPGAAALVAAEWQEWRSERPETVGSYLAPLAADNPLGAAVLFGATHPETAADRLHHTATRRVGGPLYPPINAFLNAPLALLPARTAYRVQQVNNILLAFLAGLGFSVLSRRGIWWPVASLAIILFPGFMGTLNLGQNATLTLTILVWGWALIARGRPGWGGAVWGLLAFKPVWAMVFFLLLLLTRRWRTCLTMLAVGAALGLVTLPWVGVHSWLDWLHVGKEAALLYNTDRNWVFLSRDLLGVPRRWLLDFQDPVAREPVRYPDPHGPSGWWYYLCGPRPIPGWLVPTLAGWGLLLAVLEVTVRLAVLRRGQARAVVGPPAAFLLFGAWLCCYHFMYYDVLLTALPVLVLFTEPARYLEPVYLVVVPLGRAFGARLNGYHEPRPAGGVVPRPPLLQPGYRNIWVFNRMFPTLALVLLLTQPLVPVLGLGGYFGPPWDTFVIMAMWLWAGWLWLRTPPADGGPAPTPPPAEKTAAVPLALPV
jgi:hypothetical protein